MTLNFGSPWRINIMTSPILSNTTLFSPFPTSSLSSNLLSKPHLKLSKASNLSESGNTSAAAAADDSISDLFNDNNFLLKVSVAQDADEALQIIADISQRNGGRVGVSDCCSIISAALDRNNPELALSVFYAMRSSFDQGAHQSGPLVERWKWSRPDVRVYTLLIQGLSRSLRVSDALRMIDDISRVGVSPGEEVPFGKVVRCPSCMVAVAVAQPQHGIQVVSCAKCCYKYELISGDITSIESEEISVDIPIWERGLKFLKLMKQSIPAAIHSIVVKIPSGMARTHRFATETPDLPAQEGERVTIAVAAPPYVYREVGPLKFSPRAPSFYPGEPMCLTNHNDGRELLLLRAPTKEGSSSFLNPSFLFPLLALLAAGDATSGFIDPGLPRVISLAAVASLSAGAALNTFVLPQLKRLPQRSVDAIAIRQQLLAQYDLLQYRIKDLKLSAEKEVWMLARMCQLENKIVAVGEPSYRARRSRIKRVREGLENSINGRIELIDSYARISSMIEIEIEMDADVLAAEVANNTERLAEQIMQIMELENLEERWKQQAEANDEAERLIAADPNNT